jgi:pyruvate/2-oxoglutarate dehydrogenase complex dihydrolipoamide dehydrogenase (E3) component
MKTYSFDAIVIGSGCAGYNCADWLYDLGMKNIAVMNVHSFKDAAFQFLK